MRRRTLAAGLLQGAAIVVLVACKLFDRSPGPTAANFHRLQHGMTLNEVEAVLGQHHYVCGPANGFCVTSAEWHGDGYALVVYFGSGGSDRRANDRCVVLDTTNQTYSPWAILDRLMLASFPLAEWPERKQYDGILNFEDLKGGSDAGFVADDARDSPAQTP